MFASHVTDNFVPLTTVEPAEPLDDLASLGDVLAEARVVAIGESAHWVHEYTLFRHRLTRCLSSRGFTVFALESGFSAGLAATPVLTNRMGESPEMHAHLAWLREAGVSYFGLDLPGSAATPPTVLSRPRPATGRWPRPSSGCSTGIRTRRSCSVPRAATSSGRRCR